MELKDVLGEIESDGANLVHERLLEWALTPPLWHADAAGGRPHHHARPMAPRGSTHGAARALSIRHTVRPITDLLGGAPRAGRTELLAWTQAGAVGVAGAQGSSPSSRPRGLAL